MNSILKDYTTYHTEFEDWFSHIQPNINEFSVVKSLGIVYYKNDYVQGAWIAWLYLTNKR